MSDNWWKAAGDTGIIQIENHSWDHNHPDALLFSRKHSFQTVTGLRRCNKQILKSQKYIESITGIRPTLFAYPWGESSPYLLNEYLPEHKSNHSLIAAFSCEPEMVNAQTNPWNIPRFVCGLHWKTSEELEALLSSEAC